MTAEPTHRNARVKTRLGLHKNLQSLEELRAERMEKDVELRSKSAGKRPLEPDGDDDMVCGLDVCDELNENSSDAYVNDCEGGYTDEVTLLRGDEAKARAEEDGTERKVQSLRRVDGRNMCGKNWTQTNLVDGEASTRATVNGWKFEADWSRVRNRKGQKAISQEHHC